MSDTATQRNERLDAFLKDVAEVCKKHDLSISHEDRHGGFIIEKFSEDNLGWLMDAKDGTATKS